MSPIVVPRDPDFRDLKKGPAGFPVAWWKKLDDIAEASDCERQETLIQLLRWSLSLGSPPPQPEGPEFAEVRQSTIHLAPHRWEQFDAEARTRGLPRNRVLQAHLKRAFDEWDREAANGKRKR